MSSIYGSAAGANIIYGKNNTGVAFGGAASTTVTCADPFDDSGANWTNDATANKIQIDTASYADQLAWVALSDSQGEVAYRTICGETLSNTEWYMNFNMKFVAGTDDQACFVINCCSNSDTLNKNDGYGGGATCDVIGTYFNSDGNDDASRYILYKDGSSNWVRTGENTGHNGKIVTQQGVGTLYHQLSRQTSTLSKLSIFNNSDFTDDYAYDATYPSPITQTVPSTVIDLDTWQTVSFGDGTGRLVNLQLKDLQLHDGVLP